MPRIQAASNLVRSTASAAVDVYEANVIAIGETGVNVTGED